MSQREVDILFRLLNDSASMDATAQAFDSFRNRIDDAMQSAADNSKALADTLTNELNQALNDETVALNSVGDAADQAATRLQAFREASKTAAFADVDPNEQPSVNDIVNGPGAGGEEANVGSVFGIAHAATAVGRLTKTPALGEAGGALYAAQGIRQLTDLIPNLNSVLEETGGLLPSLTDGLAAANVPMAGIVGTLGPLALAAAPVVLALGELIGLMNQEAAAEKNRLDIISQTATASTKDTSQQITTDMSKQQDTITEQTAIRTQAEKDMAAASGYSLESVQKFTETLKGLSTTGADVAADIKGSGLGVSAAVDLQGGKFQAAADAWAKAQTLIDKSTESQTALANASDSASVKANDLLDATEKHIAQQDKLTADYAADDQLTSKAAADKVTALNAEIASQQDSVTQLQKAADALPPYSEKLDAANQEIQKHKDIIAEDTANVQHLTEVSQPLIQAREQEAAITKELDKEITQYQSDLQKAATEQNTYNQQVLDAHTKSDDQLHQLIEQTSEQRQKIQLDDSRKEQDIVTQTENAIQDVRTKEGQKEAQIVQDYNNQLQDDQTKYGQDLQKLVIDEQRTEQQDAIDHQLKLAQIRQDAQNNEFDDILNRNFLKLYEDQQKQQQQTTAEDQHYQEEDTKLRTHLAQQEQDLETHLQQEEQQQQLAEQRKLAAAQLAATQAIQQQNVNEERKEEALQVSEDRQLEDLQTSYNQKQVLLEQSLNNELTLYEQNFQLREQLLIQEETQLLNQISAAGATAINNPNNPNQPIPSENYSSGVGGYATGGDFSAGIPFQMAENGAEALNIGGGRYLIPNRALVLPLQGGSVTPNGDLGGGGKQINVTVTIPISGVTDPQKVAEMVDSKLTATLQKAFLNG